MNYQMWQTSRWDQLQAVHEVWKTSPIYSKLKKKKRREKQHFKKTGHLASFLLKVLPFLSSQIDHKMLKWDSSIGICNKNIICKRIFVKRGREAITLSFKKFRSKYLCERTYYLAIWPYLLLNYLVGNDKLHIIVCFSCDLDYGLFGILPTNCIVNYLLAFVFMSQLYVYVANCSRKFYLSILFFTFKKIHRRDP